jgi:hypothetical protein
MITDRGFGFATARYSSMLNWIEAEFYWSIYRARNCTESPERMCDWSSPQTPLAEWYLKKHPMKYQRMCRAKSNNR